MNKDEITRRIEMWSNILKEIKAHIAQTPNDQFCLCYIISDMKNRTFGYPYFGGLERYYPELAKFRPRKNWNDSAYWWDPEHVNGHRARQRAVENAIDFLNKQL